MGTVSRQVTGIVAVQNGHGKISFCKAFCSLGPPAEEYTAEESTAEKKGLWGGMPESSESENHVNRMMVGDGFQNWFVNIRKPESSQPLNIERWTARKLTL